MVFGRGYLLLPLYVGRTLADHHLPRVHFAAVGGSCSSSPTGTGRADAYWYLLVRRLYDA